MTMQKPDPSDDRTVRLAEHLAFSPSFQPLFNDGMALVDETAVYLDGPGRVEAKVLSRQAATLYAAESMRLTTRLMQIASWLLLQRAANQGDMSREQVETEKTKVRLDGIGTGQGSTHFDELPEAFRALVDKVLKLERRIAMLDQEIYGSGAKAPRDDKPNPVAEQLSLLRTAFRS
jgi:regulator of CtrA degradation